jgi:hypothetical protein
MKNAFFGCARTCSAEYRRGMRRPGSVRLAIKVAAVVASVVSLTWATGEPASAQTKRIEFAKGTTSKTVSGTVRANRPVCWDFIASEGQQASFRIRGTGAYAAFLPAEWDGGSTGALQLAIMDQQTTSDSYEIELDGDNTICVATRRAKVSYRLTLSIL